MKKKAFQIILFLLILYDSAYADFSDRALVASRLFNIPLEKIDDSVAGANYDYNNWADPWREKDGGCRGYDDGHSGFDTQTKDVAGESTAERGFYSVSPGIVVKAGADAYNGIAIYDSDRKTSTIYLHADSVGVSEGDPINVGDFLGMQGSSGSGNAEHVHVENQEGKQSSYGCGASSTNNPIPPLIKYLVPTITEDMDVSDSISQKDWRYYRITGASNSTITVDLTGLSDDLDLYVKKGDRPSIDSFDCRPYLGGNSSETCQITDSGEWYIGVRGYKAGGFTVNFTFGDTDANEALVLIDKCISKFSGYFGNAVSSPYVCYSNYWCQNTSGGNLGDVNKIAVHKDLSGNVFWYYWNGWSNLSLDNCG